jgi:hypothetical protein
MIYTKQFVELHWQRRREIVWNFMANSIDCTTTDMRIEAAVNSWINVLDMSITLLTTRLSPVPWRRHPNGSSYRYLPLSLSVSLNPAPSNPFWLPDTVSGSSHCAVIYGHRNTSAENMWFYKTNDLKLLPRSGLW